ncbi:DUF732 domain-containing protein [Mycolicibacterium boenickei]|nr:DUF732 domain-containing protein [Mycolicibacterium boenickei]
MDEGPVDPAAPTGFVGADEADTKLGLAADAPTEFRDPVPVEAQQAWSIDNDFSDLDSGRTVPWPRVAAIGGAIIIAAAVVAVSIVAWDRHNQAPEPAPVAELAAEPAAPEWPADPADKAFVEEMKQRGVEVSNLRWYADNARSMCRILVEEAATPGSSTFAFAKYMVAKDEKTWDGHMLSNYVGAMFNSYCPKLWGPTPEEIDRMAPDDRYVALMADRTGQTPVDVAESVRLAHYECSQLTSGVSHTSLVESIAASNEGIGRKGWIEGVEQADRDGPKGDRAMVQALVDVSIAVYCPDMRP